MDKSTADNDLAAVGTALIRRMLEEVQEAVYLSCSPGGTPSDTLWGAGQYVNSAIETMTGFSRAELRTLGPEGFRERVHPDDRGLYLADISAATAGRQGGASAALEYRWRHKDGGYRWFGQRRALVVDDRGQPQALIVTLRDITPYKELQRALWEDEDRFRAALQNVPITVATMDTDLRYLWIYNPHLVSDPQGALGKRDDELAPPEDVAELVQFKQRVLDTGIGACRQVSVRLPDGTRHYNVAADLLRDESGNIVGLTMAALDITGQEQLQEALRESQARLAALEPALEQRVAERTARWRGMVAELSQAREQERQRLARTLHDDLQQLLVAARLHISTVRYRLTDQALLRAVQRVDEVLEEAIGTSRSLTAELCPPVLYDVGLPPALRWLAHWLEERYRLIVEVDAEDSCGQCLPSARAVLFQATRELLLNGAERASVRQAAVRLRQVEDHIELVIHMGGTGVASAADISLSDSGSAVSLAEPGELADIQQRLELFDGRLAIEGGPGDDLSVTLRVPLQTAAEGLVPPEIAAEPPAASRFKAAPLRSVREIAREATHLEGTPTPIRVVLADDHAIVREGLARLLEEAPGIELVGEASDGREAVALVRRLRPDVVLMDVSMPEMDGVEATQIILAEQPDIKIIGLSMYEEDKVGAQMRQVGAVDYVLKVGDQMALVRAVLHWGGAKP